MLKITDLQSISLEETIAYTKQKESCSITVIDNVSANQFDYVATISDRLRLNIFRIKDTKMVAIVNDTNVAIKLSRDLNKRCQIMYYDYAKRPSANLASYALTGYTPSWIVIRDKGYVVKAYDETGNQMEQWLNTDIENVIAPDFNLKPFHVLLKIRGYEYRQRCSESILELSKYHYINGGDYNEDRKCYYPKDTSTAKDIADYNKLEKLFTKFGFKSL